MSDKELSESELIGLLGTYADALEKNAAIAPQPERVSDISIQQAGADAPAEGASEMSEEQVGDEPEVIELDVVPTAHAERGRGRMLLVAAGVAVAALVGAVFVLNNDPTDVDTVEVAEEADATTTTTTTVVEDIESADTASFDAASDAATTSFVGFGGPGTVVFADGEFVSIGGGPDGAVVSRSSNGTDWSTEAIEGLPENATPAHLIDADGTWVMIVEVWPEFDEEEPDFSFFGESQQPERFIATSTDLANWTTSDFPDVEVDEGDFAYVSSLAASGDRLAIALEVQPQGDDEFRILLENDLLTEADLENFCGTSYEEGGDIVYTTCSYPEPVIAEAEVDDSSTPTTTIPPFDEEMMTEEELLRVSPGDPGYDELVDIYGGPGDMPESMVLSGPVSGPFEVADLPVLGFGTSLVGTDGGFVAISSGFEDPAVVSTSSVDGVTWSDPTPIDVTGFPTAAAVGDRIVMVSQDDDGASGIVVALVSDDLGATWTEASLPTELFGPWGEVVGGPGGFAVQLQGSTSEEAANFDPFADMEPVSIESDGYTMTMSFTDGSATLTDADGTVIQELPETAFDEDEIEGVARFEGPFQETIIWLDPETGEDLVSFGQEQMEAAFEAIMPAFEEGPMFEDMSMGTETWFSADGITWTLLDSVDSTNINESYSMIAAVGDDAVLVRSETFVEPPAELFAFEEENREPTAEEEEALDAYFMEQTNTSEWTAIPVN